MKNLSQLFLLFVLVFGVVACSDDDDTNVNEEMTIAELAIETESLSSLVAALQRADLVSVVDGTTEFTVFAPTNDAFAAFLAEKGFASLDDVPVDVLSSILLNHVVAGEVVSTDLTTGYVKSNAQESTSGNFIDLYIDTNNGVTINGASSVSTADIQASNGVVHIVDTVIDLPTVVTFATTNPNFSTLVAALTRADLPTDFVSVLLAEGPYTVFAPVNDAFGDLLAELGISGLGDIDAATLDAVLKYHVVGNANVLSTMLSDDMSVNTLVDVPFTVDLDNGATILDNRGRTANIVITDVQASNGVIHVLDRVILP